MPLRMKLTWDGPVCCPDAVLDLLLLRMPSHGEGVRLACRRCGAVTWARAEWED